MRKPAAKKVAKVELPSKTEKLPEQGDGQSEAAEASDSPLDGETEAAQASEAPVSNLSRLSSTLDLDPDASCSPSPKVEDPEMQADKEPDSQEDPEPSEPDADGAVAGDDCSDNSGGMDEGEDNHDDEDDEGEDNQDDEDEVDTGDHTPSQGDEPEHHDPEVDDEPEDESLIDAVQPLFPSPATDQPNYNIQGSFEKAGFDQLVEWCCQAVHRLPDGMRADLLEMLSGKPVLDVASACSGSDGPIMVAKAFVSAMKRLGTPMQLDHVWSCEKDARKRAFLERLFTGMKDPSEDLKSLYVDTSSLRDGPGTARVYNALTEETEKLKPCEELWMGFPCQDVSKLNFRAGDNVSVVRQAGKRTGKVFDDAMHFVEAMQDQDSQKKFHGMILENVMGLLDTPKGRNPDTGEPWRNNLQYCAHRAKAVGLIMVPFILKPALFGMPVTRQRVFMICIPRWMADEALVSEHEVSKLALQIMNTLCVPPGGGLRPLNDFLLEESSIFVREHIQRAQAKAAWRESRQKPNLKKQKWATVHAKAMQANGMDWWQAARPADATLQSHPGLAELTERQFDLCKIYGIHFPDARDAGVELSQSFRGVRAIQNNTCDIVTPGGQLLLTKKARLACGTEMMLLQGLHYGPEQFKLLDFADQQDLLADLAGNAFNSFCFAAALITKKTVEANLQMRAVVLEKQRLAAPRPAETSASSTRPMRLRADTLDDLFAWEA